MAAMLVPDQVLDNLVREASSQDHSTRTAHQSQARSRFPSSWSPESLIQLLPPKQSDTTDRTLFRRARKVRFDPDGYEQDRGLRRQIFYKSGYLSCITCNGVTFIDAAALRTIIELKAVIKSRDIRPESLPPCAVCGETKGLRVGAHDFLRLIEGTKYTMTCTACDGS